MPRDKKASTPRSTHHELVKCDLEFPRLQQELADLETEEIEQIIASVEKIQKMTWAQVLATSSKTERRGINWEVLEQSTAAGAVIASIRITGKFRARVTRSEEFMRFISLHPDHDSAYDEAGGEDI